MPRKPRQYLAGVPAHVVQRGNNRDVCFFAENDYLFYLQCLEQGCRRYQVRCHAYVLMTNHVHLLLTPSSETGISRLMQQLGRLYVQYIYNVSELDIHEIRQALEYNYPLGNDKFREQIEQALGASVGERKRGRPLRKQTG